ncbi:MAG: J domain-containing protein, partial [Lachnospiraceae bacterium]|nr:J domain-containing protein [Lachnospiraceae bacterium]
MDRTEAYRILGITQKDTPPDMKRKYRRLMMLYHPD